MSRVTRVPDLNHLECLPVRAIFSRGYTNRIKDYRKGSEYGNLSLNQMQTNRYANDKYRCFQDMPICRSPGRTQIDVATSNINFLTFLPSEVDFSHTKP